MPLDSMPIADTAEIVDFRPLTPEQRRKELVRLLRKLDADGKLVIKGPRLAEPVEFTWNYEMSISELHDNRYCGCAIGIIHLASTNSCFYEDMGRMFNTSEAVLVDVFAATGSLCMVADWPKKVTAANVADAFEKKVG